MLFQSIVVLVKYRTLTFLINTILYVCCRQALNTLESEIKIARDRLEGIEEMVDSTFNNVTAAHTNALTFAIEVSNLVSPEVNFERIKDEATKAEEEVSIQLSMLQQNWPVSRKVLFNSSLIASLVSGTNLLCF